jgi:hypothetical protein
MMMAGCLIEHTSFLDKDRAIEEDIDQVQLANRKTILGKILL